MNREGLALRLDGKYSLESTSEALRKASWGVQGGSTEEGACCQVRQPELSPQLPCAERRKQTPETCPLAVTYTLWVMEKTQTHMNK